MTNPWKRPFVPAHRKPRNPLRGAQLAPSVPVTAVVCDREACGHPRLIHRDNTRCLNATCGCEAYLPREDPS